MQYYKLSLRLRGKLTQIPDSQKLFGALVYRYADQFGDEKASLLTEKIQRMKFVLTLSNLMPANNLPVPLNWLIEKNQENKGRSDKEFYKKIKKRAYIQRDKLKDILMEPSRCPFVYPYIETRIKQQVHVSLESLKFDLQGLDPTLYSVNEHIVREISNENEEMGKITQTSSISDYDAYIGVDGEDEIEFVQFLYDLCRQKTILPLGPRMSQGLNLYEMNHLEKISLSSSEGYYLNLGMLIPDQIDYTNSYCKLFTSERRPYDLVDWKKDSYVISFIDCGSLIRTENPIHAGRCLSLENRSGIIFGNAFLFPIGGEIK